MSIFYKQLLYDFVSYSHSMSPEKQNKTHLPPQPTNQTKTNQKPKQTNPQTKNRPTKQNQPTRNK